MSITLRHGNCLATGRSFLGFELDFRAYLDAAGRLGLIA
jgi:hypothetical protein